MKKLRRRLSKLRQDEQGAALYEYALTLTVFLGLIFIIVQLSWWWWSQMLVSTAVHDSARTAGARYGNVEGGYDVAYERMRSALGTSNADDMIDDLYISAGIAWGPMGHTSTDRTVMTRLDSSGSAFWGGNVPFVGEADFGTKATSFQRDWQFYGGKPERVHGIFWE